MHFEVEWQEEIWVRPGEFMKWRRRYEDRGIAERDAEAMRRGGVKGVRIIEFRYG